LVHPSCDGDQYESEGIKCSRHLVDSLSPRAAHPEKDAADSGRSNFRAIRGLKNLDLSLSKSFVITESTRLQIRAESFNFTNTPAFGQPGATLNGLGVGQITGAGDPRRIQFGLKFIM
jgi:hypothetical protein